MRITPHRLANPDALRERFAAQIVAALAAADPASLPAAWHAALPSALALGLAATATPSAALLEHYLERMPERLVAQWTALPEPLAALVCGPVPGTRLLACLTTMARLLDEAGLSFEAHLGAATPTALLAARPSIAALYFESFFGGALPLLGLSDADRAPLLAALARGTTPTALFEHHLLGPLMHELCHGARHEVPTAPLFLLTEAAAIHLGGTIEPRHVFAEVAGEAVPAAARYFLLGLGLERLLGRGALWAVAGGTAPHAVWPAPIADAVARIAADEATRRPDDLFAADASRLLDWLRVVDLARAGAPAIPATLDAAAAIPIEALPWAHEAIDAVDWRLLDASVDLLCCKTILGPAIATVPDEIPGGTVTLDARRGELRCDARPDGVFGEPACGLVPPPIAARLLARGIETLVVRDVRRATRAIVAQKVREAAC